MSSEERKIPDIDELDTDTDASEPYEMSGLPRSLSPEEAAKQAKKLKATAKRLSKRSRGSGDEEQAARFDELFKTFSEAQKKFEKRQEQDDPDPLSLDLSSRTVKVGDVITVTVTSDGDPVNGATVSWDDRRVRTSEGSATIEPRSAGQTTVTVSNGKGYEEDSVTIEVSKRTASLEIIGPEGSVTIGKNRFQIVDETGDPVPEATVRAGDSSAQTDQDGYATVDIDTAGEVTIRASKRDSGIEYETARRTVSIPKEDRELQIDVRDRVVTVGDSTAVRVTDGHSGVKAKLLIAAQETVRTGANGVAELSFEEPGQVRIVAQKAGTDGVEYESTTTTIEVRPRRERLQFGRVEGEFVEGNDVRLEVLDSSGDPVKGATVRTDSGQQVRTDDDGWAELSLHQGGEIRVVAKKSAEDVDYESASEDWFVETHTEQVYIDEYPDIVAVDTDVEFRVTDANGDPVSGAVVKTSDGDEVRTDEKGVAVLNFDRTGLVTVTADTPDNQHESFDSVNVTVRG